MFTTYMYSALGIHWASSIPAFLALAFAPFPFLLYKYGPAIRARCKYSAEAVEVMKELQGQSRQPAPDVVSEEAKPIPVVEEEDRNRELKEKL